MQRSRSYVWDRLYRVCGTPNLISQYLMPEHIFIQDNDHRHRQNPPGTRSLTMRTNLSTFEYN